jgi:hypothetical protein
LHGSVREKRVWVNEQFQELWLIRLSIERSNGLEAHGRWVRNF